MAYGKNLSWFLRELAAASVEQYETGSIEIFGENEQEQEGSIEVEVTNLAQAAANRIDELEHALAQIITLAERVSPTFGGKRTDIAARAKESFHL